jgi:hypothetical protein
MASNPAHTHRPPEMYADRVHLHLEHPLVMRLPNRFLIRG